MTRMVRLAPLFVAAAIFFGWKCREAALERFTPPAAGAAAAAAAIASDNGLVAAAKTAQAEAAIAAHPLFRPDRLPYREQAKDAAVPARAFEAELARFTVLGTLPVDGVQKALVIRKGAGSGTERWEVGPGDSLPGFEVVAVKPEGLKLRSEGREFTLPLYAGGPKASEGGALRTESGARAPQAAATSPPSASSVSVTALPPAAAPGAAQAPPPAAQAARPAPTGLDNAIPSRAHPAFRSRRQLFQ